VETEIGFARKGDLPAMVGLLRELFTIESDFAPDDVRQERALRLIMARPDQGRLFCARSGGRTVGMANVLLTISTAEGGPVAILEDVIVAPDCRGCGLGERLTRHVLDWAAREGLARVTLLADRDNVRAHAFYERLGFNRSAMIVFRQRLSATPTRSS
jgi:ribosomal protein S18 acetylase RimI-like enzyme